MENNDDDVELLQQMIAHGGTQAFKIVPEALKKVIEEQQWINHVDKHGQSFKSFDAFVKHPLWQGLGTTVDDLRVYCRKDKAALDAVLTAMEPGRADGGDRRSADFQSDNITLKRGTGALYTLKRLKRERPDLFQEVLGGAKSANKAALEAGFRKKRRCPHCGKEL